jgi:hypothetical protein
VLGYEYYMWWWRTGFVQVVQCLGRKDAAGTSSSNDDA